jgi:hypothetical protein
MAARMETTVPEQNADDTTRATAHLPGLEIEIVHRRSPNADAEVISIHLQAAPSFEAFGRFLETANPFAFWALAAQLAWQPWLGAAAALAPREGADETLPKPPES